MKRPYVPELTAADWAVVGGGVSGLMAIVYAALYAFSDRANKHNIKKPAVFWLVLSGVVHCWIEFEMIACRGSGFMSKQLDLYAAADFRYQNPMDSGTAAMEAITSIIEGPMCFFVAYGLINNKQWRWPLQLIVTTMQIYGLIWFSIQPIWSEEGYSGHMATDDPFLFWVIAVGCNSPWGIFPPMLWYEAWRKLANAPAISAYDEKKRH